MEQKALKEIKALNEKVSVMQYNLDITLSQIQASITALQSSINILTAMTATSASISSLQSTATAINSTIGSLATSANLSTLQSTATAINSNVYIMASSTTLSAVQSAIENAITASRTAIVGSDPSITLTSINGRIL